MIPYNINTPRGQYEALLTSYARSFVLQQIDLAEKCEYEYVHVDGKVGLFATNSSEGRIQVSHFRCSCGFFCSMKLPCRHILHLRYENGVSMYDKGICDQRWTNAYFRSCHKKLKTLNKDDEFCREVEVQHPHNQALQISTRAPPKKLNAHGKFSKAMHVCKKIANILSQSS